MAADTEKYATATISSRRDLDDDLWVLRLRPSIELPFRFGQYVTVGLEIEGRIIERPYSICSAPAEEEVELFIERVPNGELSEPLHKLGEGAEVLIRKRCKGVFLRDAPLTDEPHLLVSTVTGIAPFVSLLRTLRSRAERGEWSGEHGVVALQGASFSAEFGYDEELRALDKECAWFRYVPTVSRPWEDPEWKGETGRVEDVLRKYADEAGLRPGYGGVFLCGHPQMIHNARAIMRRSGLDDRAIREEQYWPE